MSALGEGAFDEGRFCVALASATKATPGPLNKNPEVMLNAFVSASSSRSTLADLTWSLPLRGATSDLCLGSGLTANRINLFNASGLYPAFDMMFLFASTSA